MSEVVKLTPEHLHELKIFCSPQTGCLFFFNHYFISLNARNPEMTAESLLLVFQPIPFFFLFQQTRREFLSARLNLNTVSSAGSVRPRRFLHDHVQKEKGGGNNI